MGRSIEKVGRVVAGAAATALVVAAVAELGGAMKEGFRRELDKLQAWDAGDLDAFDNPHFGQHKSRSRHDSQPH